MKPHLYQAQFESGHDFPPFEGTPRTYVIASTPRSGSHMLGHALSQTGKFGAPLEYLNAANFAEWRRRLATQNVRDTLEALQRSRTSPNGVFGIKLHYSHLAAIGGPDSLEHLLPGARYILIYRRDALGQAISYARARQSGAWIAGQTPVGEARYDAVLIDELMRAVLRDTAAWRYELARLDLPYFELCYEDAVPDLPGMISRLASFLGVDLLPQEIPTNAPTSTQRSGVNQEWRERFVKDPPRRRAPFGAPAGAGIVSLVRKAARRALGSGS